MTTPVTASPDVHTLPLPPGPPPRGKYLLAQLAFVREMQADLFGVYTRLFEQYGDIARLQFGSGGDAFHLVALRDPAIIHELLVKKPHQFDKDDSFKDRRNGLARFLGQGILITDGEFWKKQRRLVAPALHTRRVESYTHTMVQEAEREIATWQPDAPLDVDTAMMRLTVRIVSKTLLGDDVEGDTTVRVAEAMEAVQAVGSDLDLLPEWVPTPKHRRDADATRALDAIIYGFINRWKERGEDRGDLLSMLMLARDDDGTGMSDRQVRDEAVTLFLAGHETTANALNWTWYLLSQHPALEARLHAELDQVLAGRAPTLDDLRNLPFTDRVVKESMRLYPPAWGFGRLANTDTSLGGCFIPRGANINISIWHMHHDERWFPQPDRFDPDRWLPERETPAMKAAYLPFGGGPRVCVGISFASLEARLVLATIAQRCRLTLPAGTHVDMLPRITLRPKGGLHMRVERR
jgi:cytochrome P450